MKKIILLTIGLLMFGMNMACVVAESDYDQAVKERDSMAAELAKAREDNRVLNQSILEIYKEREGLLERITQLEARLAENKKPTVVDQAPAETHQTSVETRQDEAETRQDESVEPEYHIVVEGDTLSEIAASTDVPMDKIREMNNMEGDVVWLGQKIRIR